MDQSLIDAAQLYVRAVCQHCGEVDERVYDEFDSFGTDHYVTPVGWRWIGDKLFCGACQEELEQSLKDAVVEARNVALQNFVSHPDPELRAKRKISP